MAERFNPFTHKRVIRPAKFKEFTNAEELGDGQSIALLLQRQDSTGRYKSGDIATRMIGQYITGEGNESGQPLDLPAMGGTVVMPEELSEALFYTVAGLLVMQQPRVDLTPYSFEELIGICLTAPDTWEEITTFANEVQTGDKTKKKRKAAPTETAKPSLELVDDTPTAIQNS